MKVLVHLRPGEGDFYLQLLKMAFPDAETLTISDEKNKADIWIGNYIYKEGNQSGFFKSEIEDEIITRCRYLRNIDNSLARSLVNRLAVGLDNLFITTKVDFVLGGMIDCYTQDVLERIVLKHKKSYVSFVGHFINGYARITSRGELNNIPRIVTDAEVEAALNQLLSDNYAPKFKLNRKKSIKDMLIIYGREYIKKYIYFPAKKFINGDFLNYHYNTVIQKGIVKNLFIRNSIEKYYKYEDSLDYIDLNKSVYMPLHFIPEATIDYWADNAQFAYQEDTIINIINNTPQEINIIIKEHPAMYLRRNINFYKKISDYKNVIIIHPYESSNKILSRVDSIAVFTGSVGVEALLRQKRVLTFTSNYYSNLHPNIHKISELNEETINKEIISYPNKLFLKDLLQGLFISKFYNDKSMFLSDMAKMSETLKIYVEYVLSNNVG